MSSRKVLLLVVVVAGLGMMLGRAGARDNARSSRKLAVVVHVNFADAGEQGHGLKNIENVLKSSEGNADVEVVCHSGGIGLVEKARTEHGELVASLIKRGVRFVACENTMRRNAIQKDDLLPGVGTVPSGTVEVIRKQQDGFAYFKP